MLTKLAFLLAPPADPRSTPSPPKAPPPPALPSAVPAALYPGLSGADLLPGASSALRFVKLPPDGCRADVLALAAAAAGGRAWLGLEPGCCCCCWEASACCCLRALEGSRHPVKGHSRQLLLTELCRHTTSKRPGKGVMSAALCGCQQIVVESSSAVG